MFSLLCVLECNKESRSNKGWLIVIILQRCNFLSKAFLELEEPMASDHLFLCYGFIFLSDKGMVVGTETAFRDSWPFVVNEEEGGREQIPFIMCSLVHAPVCCLLPSFCLLQLKYQMLCLKWAASLCVPLFCSVFWKKRYHLGSVLGSLTIRNIWGYQLTKRSSWLGLLPSIDAS